MGENNYIASPSSTASRDGKIEVNFHDLSLRVMRRFAMITA